MTHSSSSSNELVDVPVEITSELQFPFLEGASWICSKMKRDGARVRSLSRVALGFHQLGDTARGRELLADALLLFEELNPEERFRPDAFALLSGVLYLLRSSHDSNSLLENLSQPMALELLSTDSSSKLSMALARFLREEWDLGWSLLKGTNFTEAPQEEIDLTIRDLIRFGNIPSVQWSKFLSDPKYQDIVFLHILPILVHFPDHPAYEIFTSSGTRLAAWTQSVLKNSDSSEEELRMLTVAWGVPTDESSRNSITGRVEKLRLLEDPNTKIWCGRFYLLCGFPDRAFAEFKDAFEVLSREGISLSHEEFIEEIVSGILESGFKEHALSTVGSLFTPERRIRLLVEFDRRPPHDAKLLDSLRELLSNQARILDALADAVQVRQKIEWVNKLVGFGFRVGAFVAAMAALWLLSKLL